MFCQKCGKSLVVGVATPLGGVAVAPSVPAGFAAVSGRPYGGFWIRFLALIIDVIVVRIATFPLLAVLGLQHLAWFRRMDRPVDIDGMVIIATTFSTVSCILFFTHWLYDALLTSASCQGT